MLIIHFTLLGLATLESLSVMLLRLVRIQIDKILQIFLRISYFLQDQYLYFSIKTSLAFLYPEAIKDWELCLMITGISPKHNLLQLMQRGSTFINRKSQVFGGFKFLTFICFFPNASIPYPNSPLFHNQSFFSAQSYSRIAHLIR